MRPWCFAALPLLAACSLDPWTFVPRDAATRDAAEVDRAPPADLGDEQATPDVAPDLFEASVDAAPDAPSDLPAEPAADAVSDDAPDAPGDVAPTCAAPRMMCGAVCTDTSLDVANCGACGRACSSVGGMPACRSGVCAIDCAAGFLDCDGSPSNGCETSAESAENCGRCGNRCAEPTPLCRTTGAMRSCADGCAAGTTRCGMSCVDTATSGAHCGRCDNACVAPAGGAVACVAGACSPSCPAGRSLCGGQCVDVMTSAAHCGACNAACTAPTGGSVACVAGACAPSCPMGQHVCGARCVRDDDVATCGASCSPCPARPNAAPTCTAGACGFACNAGFGDCDGAPLSGCETDLTTEVEHCGGCGARCARANAAATCVAATCRLGACNPGFANCDGNATNGCEAELAFDSANCGSCLRTCSTPTQMCNDGRCVPSVVQIATGDSARHVCVNRSDQSVYCWGRNGEGQHGNGDTGVDEVRPLRVPGLLLSGSLFVGATHTCTRAGDNTLRCWGGNANGQLGFGNTTPLARPPSAATLTDAASGAAGVGSTCVYLASGEVRCAGSNAEGQLGRGAVGADALTFAPVPGLSMVVQLAAGPRHYVARRADGTVWSWGHNRWGGLGDGSEVDYRAAPVRVGALSGVTQITSSCALLSDGAVWCWGANGYGQLGDGTVVESGGRSTVGAVPGVTTATQISGSGEGGHICARLRDATVTCWGYNGSGAIGDGTTTHRTRPTPVPGLAGVQSVWCGGGATCALLGSGNVACWGNNGDGMVGDGTRANRTRPVRVIFPD